MSLTQENILDIILGRIPWPASEADFMGIPGLDGVYQDGVEPSAGLRTDLPLGLSAAELIAAMNNNEFQDFKNQVARGERKVLDPPKPFWDAETKDAAIHALGLDEEGLWWTDDAKNLVYHPEGILEGLGQVITSIPGGFFGGMEAITRAINCVALSNEVDLENFHEYITEGFEEKAHEWDFLVYEPRTKGANLVGLALSAPAVMLSDAGRSLASLEAFENSPNIRGGLRLLGDFGGAVTLAKLYKNSVSKKTPPSLAAQEHLELVKQFQEAGNQVPSLGLKDKVKRAFSSDRKYPERELLDLHKKTLEPSPSLLDILSPEEIAEHWNRMSSLEKHILSNSKIMMVNGRPVAFLKGTKIDPLVKKKDGPLNYRALKEGYAPESSDGQILQLHHGGQMDDGIIFPLYEKPHSIIPKRKGRAEINRSAFGKYRSDFWQKGGEFYGP
ncbi:A nuclease of the HNH/ENDO VII superfamily with conserved LHH [Desulfatibacillum alkenivorans DSM 16219]|uniref:A nuclease of the HNH/ENDO VII superfamily with conserved LHH n=1 Tax=Desulfatibacillum alkenivorans DSM 16219 TaxID=1121393 RepID=A0A1M6L6D4_9BACT|nr:HNH/ENDO VII family nuclease [Desulfatibacillum alkenivorans]SHJ66781.1 A nuclease of the HNH/ENDO VII superfamily with conserved LHH [Desulfatibacillum alkenivorans DSM 16219]